MITTIPGGVCAAKGFKASGIHCGFRKNKTKKDLALIVSQTPAQAASVYTKNLVQGAPIAVTKEHLQNGIAQAIVCNSGNANTCNANGVAVANQMCGLVSEHTNIPAQDIIVASTGVIGQPLDLTPMEQHISALVDGLGEHSQDAAHAIMTTDTILKEIAVEFELGGKTCRMGGIGKGSGMIHPNMATMLVFLTTDVAISAEMLQQALTHDIDDTFHMVSIDGDTSTNDMVSILANGLAGNPIVAADGKDYQAFCEALNTITTYLCRSIAKDGEGATKLLECKVDGAQNIKTAKTVAKSVICSDLFKAAMYGADANWGRILCAIGYSGAAVDVDRIDVTFASQNGEIAVCKNGKGIDFSEELAKQVLSADEILILIHLNQADCQAVAWGCDLTYDYVKINGDYRT